MRLRENITIPNRFDETVFKTKHKDSTKPHYPQLLAAQVVPFDHSKQDAAFPSLPLVSHPRTIEAALTEECGDEISSTDLDKKHSTISLSGQLLNCIGSEMMDLPEEEAIQSTEDSDNVTEECSTCHKQTIEWHSLTLACQVRIFTFFLQSQKYVEVVATTLKLTHQELGVMESHLNLRKIHKASLESIWAYGVAKSGLGPGIIQPHDMDDIMEYLLFASRYEVTDEVDIIRGKQFLRELGFKDQAILLFENHEGEQHQKQVTTPTLPHPIVQRRRRRKSLNNSLRVKTIHANIFGKENKNALSAPASTLRFTNIRGSEQDEMIEKPKPKRIRLSIDEDGLATITHESADSEPVFRTVSLPTSMPKSSSMLPISAMKRSLSSCQTPLPGDNGGNENSRMKLPVLGRFKVSNSVSSQSSAARTIQKISESKKTERSKSEGRPLTAAEIPIGITQTNKATGSEALEQQNKQPKKGPETPNNRATQLPTGDTTIDVLGDTESFRQQLIEVASPKPPHRNTFRDAFGQEHNLDVQGFEISGSAQKGIEKPVAENTTKHDQRDQAHRNDPCYSPISDQDPESLPPWARLRASSPPREPLCHTRFSEYSSQLSFQRRAPTSISSNAFLQSILDVSATPTCELSDADERTGNFQDRKGSGISGILRKPMETGISIARPQPRFARTTSSAVDISEPFVTSANPGANGSIEVNACKSDQAVFSPRIHHPVASTIELNTSASTQVDPGQVDQDQSSRRVQWKSHYFVSLETLEQSAMPQADNMSSHGTNDSNLATLCESSDDPLSKADTTQPKSTSKSLKSSTKPKPTTQSKPKSKSTSKAPSSPPSKHTRRASASAKPRTRSSGPVSPTKALSTTASGSTKKRRSDYGSKRKPYKKRSSVAVVPVQNESSVDADDEQGVTASTISAEK